jgi:hypothetical protein
MTSYRLEVLNQAPVRGHRAAHVATGLNEVGALAVPYIVLRNDHMDSLAIGVAVSESRPLPLPKSALCGRGQNVN